MGEVVIGRRREVVGSGAGRDNKNSGDKSGLTKGKEVSQSEAKKSQTASHFEVGRRTC
jgi:hypothetical protein